GRPRDSAGGADQLASRARRAFVGGAGSTSYRLTSCTVTPWAFTLPGLPYGGDDPEGFAPLREIQAYIQHYVAVLDPPAPAGRARHIKRRRGDGGYVVETPAAAQRKRSKPLLIADRFDRAPRTRYSFRIAAVKT